MLVAALQRSSTQGWCLIVSSIISCCKPSAMCTGSPDWGSMASSCRRKDFVAQDVRNIRKPYQEKTHQSDLSHSGKTPRAILIKADNLCAALRIHSCTGLGGRNAAHLIQHSLLCPIATSFTGYTETASFPNNSVDRNLPGPVQKPFISVC